MKKRHFFILAAMIALTPLFSCGKGIHNRLNGHQERVIKSELKNEQKKSGEKIAADNFDCHFFSPVPESVFKKMEGKSFPKDCPVDIKELTYMKFSHYGFDGKTHTGELVVNKAVAEKLTRIFHQLYEAKYQIEKIKLIDEYGADDEASMSDNNTSAFCYRKIAGSTNLSVHAKGLAIDINPLYNPCVHYKNGKISKVEPKNGQAYVERAANDPRRIKKGDFIYKLFVTNGFTWGGDWKTLKDYQHFEYDPEKE